ncbi:MAG: lipase family protein [Pseudomonadota bacterium]
MPNMLPAPTAALLSDAVYNLRPLGNDNVLAAFRQGAGSRAAFDRDFADFEISSDTPRFTGESGAIIKKTTGFATLLKMRGGSEYALTLRGTQMTSASDWLSNGNITMDKGSTGVPVHAGFNRIFKSMHQDIRNAMRGLNPTTVHVMGHSLGGALANLFAAEFSVNQKLDVRLYTFGAPRPGTSFFTNQLAQQLQGVKSARVFDYADPVPMIPLWPFYHCPTAPMGLETGAGAINPFAHKMGANYAKQVAGGWPPIATRPPNQTVKYWLDKADTCSGPFSWVACKALGYALNGLLKLAQGLGIGLNLTVMGIVTLLDQLSNILMFVARLVGEIGDAVLGFIRSALRFLGLAARATVSMADLTTQFIRSILDRMYSFVASQASRALGRPN